MSNQGSKNLKTFTYQDSLPRLPIPSLEETTTKYLRSLRPLISKQELAVVEEQVKDFIKPNGLGNLLQQRLIDIDNIAPDNWLDDTWWIKKAYQEWRVPLIINSNWFFMYIDDSNTPGEYLASRNDTRFKGIFSEFQVKRNVTRSYPLCMHQYTRAYGLTRIPQHGCDALNHTKHPNQFRHVIVTARNQYYILECYDVDGNRLSDGDIEQQIWEIINNVLQTEYDPPVGILTGDDRDSWTVAREHLLTLSPQNRETLNLIESALFVVNLDDYSSGDNLDQFLGNIFHGNGYNRWFDKSMSIIVESNGVAGMHGEHSPCDALVTAFIAEWTLIEPTDLDAKTSGRKIPSPRRIRFVTNQQTLKFIQDAEKRISQVIADSDVTVLHSSEYGTHFIKKIDAYIQMVIQLAYYKLHRKVVPTYETGSTRQFRHGRTETIRTLSAESKAFVEGMENNSLSTKEKYGLLQAAVKAHSEYTRDASNGKGCDRHLLGLRLLLKEGESHPLFQHPIFAKSQEWLLSTSGLTTGTKFNGTGFGCVYPNGYGINYLPGEHVLKFGMESKKSSTETDTKKFKETGGLIYQKDFNEGLAKLSANEYLVLAGTLHSVHAITSQISPVRNSTSSGLEVLEADTFKLYCYQTLTGTKFLILADPAHPSIDVLLHRTYVIYSDYAMKNPFYTPEMPIRSELFDLNLLKLIKQFGGV
ncbi:6747_t:CDS:10 [Entrophospora sp. SA101]|nr:6747_t:CDS:10 [Entrophospora sp. SA101]